MKKNLPLRVVPYQNTSKCTILIKFSNSDDISGHSLEGTYYLTFEHMKPSRERKDYYRMEMKAWAD